jgi:tRNA threonylcarbamoyladenosine biosynthesis protein TsaB
LREEKHMANTNNKVIKILAIETATPAFSVALRVGAETIEKFSVAPMKHAELILPSIEKLLAEAALTVNQLDAIAVSYGPGGFTSVRLGVSVAQGLAFAANLPVIPVSTLQTLAQSAYAETREKKVLAVLDARMHEVYWSAYALNDATNVMENVVPDSLIKPDTIILQEEFSLNEWIGAGSGWQTYGDQLKTLCEDFYVRKNSLFIKELQKNEKNIIEPAAHGDLTMEIYPDIHPHARDVAHIATHAYQRGKTITATELAPIYLRDAVQR